MWGEHIFDLALFQTLGYNEPEKESEGGTFTLLYLKRRT